MWVSGSLGLWGLGFFGLENLPKSVWPKSVNTLNHQKWPKSVWPKVGQAHNWPKSVRELAKVGLAKVGHDPGETLGVGLCPQHPGGHAYGQDSRVLLPSGTGHGFATVRPECGLPHVDGVPESRGVCPPNLTSKLWSGSVLHSSNALSPPDPNGKLAIPCKASERAKMGAGEGKKTRNFWPSQPSGPHPSGPHPSGQQFGAPPFGAPTLRVPFSPSSPLPPLPPLRLALSGTGPNRSGLNRLNGLAQSGLALSAAAPVSTGRLRCVGCPCQRRRARTPQCQGAVVVDMTAADNRR